MRRGSVKRLNGRLLRLVGLTMSVGSGFNGGMMKVLIFIFLLLTACGHTESRFEEKLLSQDCDEAAAHLPGSDPLGKTAKGVKYIGKNLAAYSYITASYTTEVLWDVAGGTVLFVGLCGPLIAVQAAGNFSVGAVAHPSEVCLPIPWDKESRGIFAPPLGRQAIRQTKEFRCPDLSTVSASLQKVASCYESKGDRESLKKAVDSLENIEKSKDFFTCLEPSDQALVISRRETLQRQLNEL